MKKIIFILLFAFALLVPFSVPAFSHADTGQPCNQQGGNNGNFVPLEPCSPLVQYENDQTASIQGLLQELYKICVGIAVVLTILQLTRAGIMYMGGDSITNKEEAKHLIQVSLLGLLLVLSPVIVFSLINPDMLTFNLNFDALKTNMGPQQGQVTPEQQPAPPNQQNLNPGDGNGPGGKFGG